MEGTATETVSLKNDNAVHKSLVTSLLPQFPHSDQSYKCIFGLVHVKYATIVIATSSVLGLFTSISWRIVRYLSNNHASVGNTLLTIVPAIVAGAAAVLLLVGVIRRKCEYLLPFVFVQITAALLSTVVLVMVIIFILCDIQYITNIFIDPEDHSLAKAMLISVLVFQLLLNIWATRVVCACYRYFDEFQTFRKQHFDS